VGIDNAERLEKFGILDDVLPGGLQNIPESLYEAAEIDGASILQKTLKITLPLLTRTMSFVLVANTAFNFLSFARFT
jgi:multiple sugar transport system permease protein